MLLTQVTALVSALAALFAAYHALQANKGTRGARKVSDDTNAVVKDVAEIAGEIKDDTKVIRNGKT